MMLPRSPGRFHHTSLITTPASLHQSPSHFILSIGRVLVLSLRTVIRALLLPFAATTSLPAEASVWPRAVDSFHLSHFLPPSPSTSSTRVSSHKSRSLPVSGEQDGWPHICCRARGLLVRARPGVAGVCAGPAEQRDRRRLDRSFRLDRSDVRDPSFADPSTRWSISR